MTASSPIAFVVKHFSGGGVARCTLNLAKGLVKKGHEIDIVMLSAHGDYRDEAFSRFSFYYFARRRRDLSLLNHFREHNIKARWLVTDPVSRVTRPLSRTFGRFALKRRYPNLYFDRQQVRESIGIQRYIRMRRPKIMLSAEGRAILPTLNGCYLANASLPIIASIHSAPEFRPSGEQSQMQELLPEVDAVVCVSRGVAESAIRNWHIDEEKVFSIHNPISDDIYQLSKAKITHPWFKSGAAPVILTVARIDPPKDFSTLLSAFALVCEKRDARLVIISPQGSSQEAASLVSRTIELGIRQKVDILGFDQNPYRYMRRSSCFVLSTKSEGFGNVLPEAMACGIPVVSTDAPYGPSEILEDGRWGKLVPIGDVPAMAHAIEETLDGDRPTASELMARSQSFSLERAIAAYQDLIDRMTEKADSRPA